MQKAYNKIVFINDSAPALNATNLNKISTALDTIDSRVVELSNNPSQTITYSETSDTFTITITTQD